LLSWNGLSYLASYEIYRFNDRSSDYHLFTPIVITGNANYKDTLPAGAGPYYYQIVGKNVANETVVISDKSLPFYTGGAPIDPIPFVIIGAVGAGVVVSWTVYKKKHYKYGFRI
jgi:hypothetical protein